ncbi:MAG: hypothetical protein ABFD76_05200 [Smithella sp.]
MEQYDLQNAILKAAAKPQSEQAVFSIKKPAGEYAADRSAADATTTINAQKLAQSEKQFIQRLLNAHNQLKTFSKQNTLTTLISAAGIPLQLNANQEAKASAGRQEAMTQKLIDLEQQKINMTKAANAEQAKKVEVFNHNQAYAADPGPAFDLSPVTPVNTDNIVNLRDIVPAKPISLKPSKPLDVNSLINLKDIAAVYNPAIPYIVQ